MSKSGPGLSSSNTSAKRAVSARDLGERIYEEASDILNGYFPLPSPRNPWFLLPVDDAGPVYYFVTHVLSSRYRKRRFAISLLRIVTQVGLYRLWPLVAPVLLRVAWARTQNK